MAKRPIMIMGCTSDAGKSFLVTALCRHFANQGLRVAPFKAQNMSNNAAVTTEGLEIGRAQYLQALAARIPPQARMNPVLLKPSAETYSQVIVLGKFHPEISALPWLARKPQLWPIVREALQSLLADYDQVVIEGAGSPAEVNLRQSDIVNMRVALECQADVYLVADIDRGGAFAHLLGTWMCLEPAEQALIKGFVLNKFRGDQALLGNAMDWLQERTGVPTVAIVPMVRHALPDEDTFHHRAAAVPGQINIALLLYPYASNLDEFDPLIHTPGVNVVPIRTLTSLQDFQAVILPGSKNTVESLRYLRQTGLEREVLGAATRGQLILGVCGGMQLLGRDIFDPSHLESGDSAGLNLLELTTTLAPYKITQQRETDWLNGGTVHGYEIHHGQTQAGSSVQPHLADGLGWQQANIYGVYLHGLLENTQYRQWFLEQVGWRGQAEDWAALVEAELEKAAQLVTATGWFNS
ncbi:MAG: cobyric acid synthase [Chloroflexi bacterium]|nr:cobyric acid synthase [Chloroflexota bacterium]